MCLVMLLQVVLSGAPGLPISPYEDAARRPELAVGTRLGACSFSEIEGTGIGFEGYLSVPLGSSLGLDLRIGHVSADDEGAKLIMDYYAVSPHVRLGLGRGVKFRVGVSVMFLNPDYNLDGDGRLDFVGLGFIDADVDLEDTLGMGAWAQIAFPVRQGVRLAFFVEALFAKTDQIFFTYDPSTSTGEVDEDELDLDYVFAGVAVEMALD